MFFLLYFATGANLCWRRLARAPCQSLHHAVNQGRVCASNFPVSLLSLLGGVDCVVLQLQLHGVWLFCRVRSGLQPLLRGKRGSRQMYGTKGPYQVFLWYWLGKYQENTNQYQTKIPNRDATLAIKLCERIKIWQETTVLRS